MARESGRQPGGPTAAKTLAWKVRVAGRSERGQGPGEVTGPDCGGPCGQEAIQGLVVSGGSGRSTGAAELAAALEGQKRWGQKRSRASERGGRRTGEATGEAAGGSRVVAEEGGAGRGGFPCAPTAELPTAQWTKCGVREEERNYRRCRQPCRARAGRPSEVTDLHLGQVAAGG